ncbi:MAG: hypothetical protein JWM93_1469, partial [Frankiales bacterium]|nr:hypothetical protein [Frankiales bacterium]
YVQQLTAEAQNATNNGNPAHLQNMVQHVENIANAFGQFPSSPDASAFQTLLGEANDQVEKIQEAQLRAGERIRLSQEEQQAERAAAREATSLHLRDLETQREYAAGLIEALGKDVTATEFLTTAKEEGNAADEWRKYTLIGAALAGVATIALSFYSADGKTSHIAAHASASLTLVLGVIYLGRQAAEHRTQQRRARTLGLQLASVGPFLVGLDSEHRMEVRKMLADRFFTGDKHDEAPAGAAKDKGYPTTQELVQAIITQAMKK